MQLDELDYANVFGRGRRRGTRRAKDLAARRIPDAEPSPSYDERSTSSTRTTRTDPSPVPRAGGGRRRELVALGLAAGVIVALGVGSQVFAGDDEPDKGPSRTTTSTTIPRQRVVGRHDRPRPHPPDHAGGRAHGRRPRTSVPHDDHPARRTTTTVRNNNTTTTARGADDHHGRAHHHRGAHDHRGAAPAHHHHPGTRRPDRS